MKQEKLLDALNYVNQEYIDQATPKTISRSRLRPWMALAACLALAVGIFAAARLARPAAEPELQASPHEAAEEAPKEDPCYPEPNADAQTILDYRFGPMYLGMPFDEVTALYGEPMNPSLNGITRVYVYYKLSEDSEGYSDLGLDLADKGDGWIVNNISLSTNHGFDLPHGVKIGMTDAELRAAWPEITEEAEYTADAGFGEENGIEFTYSSYSQYNGHLSFSISLKNGVVDSVSLGSYYEEPHWILDEPDPKEPYDFSSGEITVWRRTDGGWESVEKTGQGAKMLETIFTIEDLVLLEQVPDEIRYVVDFQNDTVWLVCAPEEGITAGPNTPPDAWGAVYRLEDRDAFEASLAAGDAVPQGLICLKQCVFPYGTWDTLGESFE